MHAAEATGTSRLGAAGSRQRMLPHNTPSSTTHMAESGSSAKDAVLSVWASTLNLLGSMVSRVLYAMNSVFSGMDFPTWVLQLLSALAQGPFRTKLLQLYAEDGDHTRRLSAVQANGKFSSVQAGPDEPWEVGHATAVRTHTFHVLLSSGFHCGEKIPKKLSCSLMSCSVKRWIFGSLQWVRQSTRLHSRIKGISGFVTCTSRH